MRVEAWPEASKEFQAAIDIDPQYEDAYYGLGLANMRMKKYAEAIAAYVKCRDLYRSMAGKQFTSRQDAQRYRQNRLTEIDEIIRQYQTGPQTAATQDRLRQLQQQRREIEDYIARGSNMTVENSVPAFVYLALGSAYFRTEQLSRRRARIQSRDCRRTQGRAKPSTTSPPVSANRSLQGSRRGGEVGGEGRLQSASATEAGHQGQVRQVERTK